MVLSELPKVCYNQTKINNVMIINEQQNVFGTIFS